MSIAEDILSGALDPRRAAVGVQAYNVFIRALEQERKIEEQEEISGRVEVLERRIEAGGWRREHHKKQVEA